MPTGYTEAVQSGAITTLPAFALRCARAFGAAITMRDDPMDAPLPEAFTPRTGYNDERLPQAQAALARLLTMTPEQAEVAAFDAHQAEAASYQKYVAEKRAHRKRYTAMLAQVEAWQPDPEVASLRDFMLEQLRTSLDFDCGYEAPAPVRMGAEAWREKAIAEAERDVKYHTKAIADEVERTAGRNRWLAALRASLPAT